MPSFLPNDLIDYLRSDAPSEGGLLRDPWWFSLWPEADIETMNLKYEVRELAPTLYGFGSNGGGEMFAFNRQGHVLTVPFIGMGDKEAQVFSTTWRDFTMAMESRA